MYLLTNIDWKGGSFEPPVIIWSFFFQKKKQMFQINNHQDVYIHVHFIKFGAIYVYVRFMGEILETNGLKYLQKAFNKFLKIQIRGNTSIKDSK